MHPTRRRPRRHPFVRFLLRLAERASIKREAMRFATFASCGLPPSGWWRVLKANRFAVDLRYWPVMAFALLISPLNALNKWRENRLYGAAIAQTEVQAPIFILGHWRSGTTLLHELLALDERFAYPTFFQVLRPYTFIGEEALALRHLQDFCPETRPMDNVSYGLNAPAEDEWTLTQLTLMSPQVGWFFPRNAEHYDRYLTFEGVPEKEIARWKRGMLDSLRKLSYHHGKRMVLKSPAHTGRIPQLLELFPEARFVHIHRNPYHVYRSTEGLYRRGISLLNLQEIDQETVVQGILRRYRMMYEAFFATRDRIPPGQYCEVRFEDLEQDKYGETRRIYETLGLGGFEAMEPDLRAYCEAVSDYQKNVYDPLPDEIRQRVAEEWGRCFDEWGYPR
ncbi:MAG: sulfotransferase [Anaerolineae bacterium]|nr:sulfotransferase [Anaerolineae bacterium]